ncbi:site-specific integrase [Mucilaginibacter gynuensis]|uniref:Site-specific integrase n=1 Tax=Mucilaginibacter gynuensis TaxID=1302236 RepID=A0ABP8GB70_9SPHI
MKTTQSFGIHFTARADKEKNGKLPIYACITVNRKKCFFAVKQYVDLKNWDNRKGAAKGTKDDIRSINTYLEEVRRSLSNIYQQMQLKGVYLTADAVKDVYFNADVQVHKLSDLFAYHNETSLSTIKPITLKHYFVTQRYLTKFLKAHFKKGDIFLHELNYKFIHDFETFLYNHKPVGHQKPIQTNGVVKHMVRIKKMIGLAVKLEWLEKNPFVKYSIKAKKVNRECLSLPELSAIENKIFNIPRLGLIRDLFVFSCYTGLAYVDLINLTQDNLVQGNDGEYWIKTSRQKTETSVSTPLLPKALEILVSYQGNERALAADRLFPVISNQKVNSYLKEIADLCGINKSITFHLARHTFATTVTLSNGVPIETVSKILGHTKIATTQIYAKVLENKISSDMQALRLKLSAQS